MQAGESVVISMWGEGECHADRRVCCHQYVKIAVRGGRGWCRQESLLSSVCEERESVMQTGESVVISMWKLRWGEGEGGAGRRVCCHQYVRRGRVWCRQSLLSSVCEERESVMQTESVVISTWKLRWGEGEGDADRRVCCHQYVEITVRRGRGWCRQESLLSSVRGNYGEGRERVVQAGDVVFCHQYSWSNFLDLWSVASDTTQRASSMYETAWYQF